MPQASRWLFFSHWAFVLGIVCSPLPALAQYSAHITTPYQGASSSYFERMGFGFSGNIGNNVFFNNGGMNNVRPGLGGNNNFGGGAQGGFGIRGNGFGMNFGFQADSGYDASSSSITPSVTVQNGGTGAIFSGQQRPFVTGLVPLVGEFTPGVGYAPPPQIYRSPLVERMVRMHDELASASKPARPTATPVTVAVEPPPRPVSSAERGDLSLSQIRAQQAAETDSLAAEIAEFIAQGEAREAAGQYGQAAIHYQRAASRADGELKQQLLNKIATLKASRTK